MVRNIGSWHQKWRKGWVCRGRAPGMGRSGLACHTVGYRLPGWARVWRRPKDAGPWVLPFPTLGLPGSLLPPCPRHLIRLWKWAAPAGPSAISGWQVIIIKQEGMGPLSLVTWEAQKSWCLWSSFPAGYDRPFTKPTVGSFIAIQFTQSEPSLGRGGLKQYNFNT